MPKITIDWVNKIIDINSGETLLDVRTHIYSEWKRQVLLSDNAKWAQAMATVGGETLPGGKFVPSFFFLINDWKLRAYTGTDTILVGVNLFTDTGASPFIAGGTRSSIVAETTTGVSVSTSGGGGVSPADLLAIADAVWDEAAAGHVSVGTTGKLLKDAKDEASAAKALSA